LGKFLKKILGIFLRIKSENIPEKVRIFGKVLENFNFLGKFLKKILGIFLRIKSEIIPKKV